MILVEAEGRQSKFSNRSVKLLVTWHWEGENVVYLSDIIESETSDLHKLLHVTVERFIDWIFWSIPLYFRCEVKIREVELSTQASRELVQNRD